MGRHAPLHNPYGVDEGEPVGIFIGFQGGFMHQAADGVVRHQQTVEFLLNEFRCLTAQNNLSATQMRFELVQRVFDFPAFVIQCR